MRRVCILTSSHTEFDPRIFHKQAITLQENGYDVQLLTNHWKEQTLEGVDVLSMGEPNSHTGRLLALPRMYRRARRIKADVYHFHEPGLLPIGAALALRTDAKVIYDCHEDYAVAFRHYDFPPDLLNPLVSVLYPWFELLFTAPLDVVVTANDWNADTLRERGHNDVVNIRNFPKVDGITIGEPPVERTHDFQLVYVGGLSRIRGLFRMLELTNRLRSNGYDVGLWLLGSFSGDSEEVEAKEYIDQNGLDEHVELFGRIEYEEIFSYLAAADVGLVLRDPERYSGSIPTKLFEYMYAGLPVVASDSVANQTYLPSECGTLVSTADTDAQVTAVSELLQDEDKRTEMGQKGRKIVEEKYSWEAESQVLLDLYEDLLAE